MTLLTATVANPIFCAVDTSDLASAQKLARDIRGAVGGLKLGLEFFIAHGPEGVRAVAGEGQPIFLDLKLHDIPNTVAGAARAAGNLGVDRLTVHAGGGPAMLMAAVDAAKAGARPPKVVAVTVLTSLDAKDLNLIGFGRPVSEQVLRMTVLAQEAGCDGVVCSPEEVRLLRSEVGPDFLLVVPGVRSAGADVGDQKRVATAGAAIKAGADLLVIGRGITAAADRRAAAMAFSDEVAAARRARAH